MSDAGRETSGGRALRVGVVNLMPRLETYEPSLRALFAASGHAVEPVWIRLATHAYRSSDPAHLDAHYRSYERAQEDGVLDGLLLTGAPVEHLPLAEVRYWPELSQLLDDARDRLRGTLGICWGAMALAEREGVRKAVFARKVFGVYRHTTSSHAKELLGLDGPEFACPQSRFAGFDRAETEQAERAGRVLTLGDGSDAGPTLLATPDGAVMMHLGHPEYDASRLGFEWRRDAAAGRTDVDPPRGYDLERDRPELDWSSDSAAFLRGWLDRLG
ncbi:MAG: homoserine O-succinyltransferase [Deltaproteobacteria bacterium]|nr:homoserine O-succinyltransferase [Deltaproteobacteria bacterium]